LSLHGTLCISLYALSSEHQIMVRFTYHFKTVGPQYGTCFVSDFRHQEFGGSFYICGKLVDPTPRYILAKFHFHDL